MNIAILGAGILGSCSALELARRGYAVDLYDVCSAPMSRASYFNEGKIHTGIIYARDESLATARRMIEGAIHFQAALSRWVDTDGALFCSRPFLYGVDRESLVGSDALEAYYRECRSLFEAAQRRAGVSYLGRGEGLEFRRLRRDEWAGLVNPEFFEGMFETNEYSVDPVLVAAHLTRALERCPDVTPHYGRRVVSVEDGASGGLEVVVADAQGNRTARAYDQVVNCLWQGRLRIDQDRGIPLPASWMHRYKFSNRIHVGVPDAVPSLTIVLGPFGDIVNYGERGLYLSWYPTGVAGISSDVSPPDWDGSISDAQRLEVFWKGFEAWSERCPVLGEVAFDESRLELGGGVIYALGSTDVDDYDSKLHDRYEVGLQTYGDYHSVDTGKYTLAPLLAIHVADRVSGR
jgi:hypothetical protein